MTNEYLLEPEEIVEKAKNIRKRIIKMNSEAGQGHTGADLSEADILASLFFRILKFEKNSANRSKFTSAKSVVE